jgi:hypothetical protein
MTQPDRETAIPADIKQAVHVVLHYNLYSGFRDASNFKYISRDLKQREVSEGRTGSGLATRFSKGSAPDHATLESAYATILEGRRTNLAYTYLSQIAGQNTPLRPVANQLMVSMRPQSEQLQFQPGSAPIAGATPGQFQVTVRSDSSNIIPPIPAATYTTDVHGSATYGQSTPGSQQPAAADPAYGYTPQGYGYAPQGGTYTSSAGPVAGSQQAAAADPTYGYAPQGTYASSAGPVAGSQQAAAVDPTYGYAPQGGTYTSYAGPVAGSQQPAAEAHQYAPPAVFTSPAAEPQQPPRLTVNTGVTSLPEDWTPSPPTAGQGPWSPAYQPYQTYQRYEPSEVSVTPEQTPVDNGARYGASSSRQPQVVAPQRFASVHPVISDVRDFGPGSTTPVTGYGQPAEVTERHRRSSGGQAPAGRRSRGQVPRAATAESSRTEHRSRTEHVRSRTDPTSRTARGPVRGATPPPGR